MRARFGEGVISSDGTVDRPALGRAAFGQEGGMAFLESLVHPRVGAARERWIAECRERRPAPALLVCEVPLLFEAGLQDLFDAVLVVTAAEDVRRERVAARGQDFAERAARQTPEPEKVARADRAYVNDGGLEGLRAWVADRYAEYSGRACDAPLDPH